MTKLTGHRIAVVGASSGIGLATAALAAAQGAEVIMLSRSRQRLDDASRMVNGQVRVVPLDMLDEPSVFRVFESVGPIDHVVATAVSDELAAQGSVADLTQGQVEQSLRKFRGYVNITRAATSQLKKFSTITLVAGAGALKAPRGMSLLSAANAAIEAFGKALAFELAPVRVNMVLPGPVDTGLHGPNRDRVRTWAETLPARHFTAPAEVAEGILFLISSPSVTGHSLVIDSGHAMS